MHHILRNLNPWIKDVVSAIRADDTTAAAAPEHQPVGAAAAPETDSGALQPRGGVAHTNATQPATPPNLESIDCIIEIFAGHAKNDRRFVFDRAAFELALIDPPPLRKIA